jgi:hypothetical protein
MTEAETIEHKDKIIRWLMSGDTGISSEKILCTMEGMMPRRNWGSAHPSDPSDLGRCLRLLAKFPTYFARLSVMKAVSPEWKGLIENWAELESLYWQELPQRSAPRCYARMREIIEAAQTEQPTT